MQKIQCGSIQMIIGCMFSGKTTALMIEFQKWASIAKNPLCINSLSCKYENIMENKMYSHNNESIKCIYVFKLSEISEEIIRNADIILINEGQFFTDIVEYCKLWCDKFGKHIIICGLDGDFKREPFGNFLDLIPLSDEVKKISALCVRCANGTLAHFSYRKSKVQGQILIGNDYEPLCRKCYLDAMNS